MSNIFKGLESIVLFPEISKWKTDNIADMSLFFSYFCSVNSFPDFSNCSTKNVEAIQLNFV